MDQHQSASSAITTLQVKCELSALVEQTSEMMMMMIVHQKMMIGWSISWLVNIFTTHSHEDRFQDFQAQ